MLKKLFSMIMRAVLSSIRGSLCCRLLLHHVFDSWDTFIFVVIVNIDSHMS